MKYQNFQSDLIKNFISYLIILLPVSLVSGPLITDLSIILISISSFFFLRNKKFFYNYFFLFFICFWLIILISSSLSEHKYLAFKNSLFYFRFGFFSLFFWFLIEYDKKLLKKIYLVLFLTFIVLIFDSFYQFLNGANIINMEVIQKNRISSFFGDELKLGGFLMRLFPILMSLTFLFYDEKKHKKYHLLFFLFIILIYINIYLTGERNSFFLFNIMILFYLVFIYKFEVTRLLFFLFFLFLTIILVISDNPFKKRIIDRTLSQVFSETNSKMYIFSEQHNEHYISAWRIFKDNKVIGIGPKNFREICKKPKYNLSELTCSTHPHNYSLQLLSEAGLFSFLIYAALNFIIWYNLFKSVILKFFSKKNYLSNFQISILISVAISVFPFAPSGSFFNNWNSTIYYLPFGILLWSFRNSKKMYINTTKF